MGYFVNMREVAVDIMILHIIILHLMIYMNILKYGLMDLLTKII